MASYRIPVYLAQLVVLVCWEYSPKQNIADYSSSVKGKAISVTVRGGS
jgi:hypothetical protein